MLYTSVYRHLGSMSERVHIY